MKKVLLSLLLTTLLSGCATIHMDAGKEEPVALQPRESLANKLPELDGPPITIAVYGFQDKTGQMKPNDKLAVFSKAVTQGSEVFLIKSLQDSRNWFKVVERVGLDNLIKERQLIRNQREVYEGKDAKPLKPMTVAGVMIEGGIIGYDSNIRSGGNGARFLGIGGSQQYRVDEIVISLRLISVNSGEVLLSNAVSKTIFSTQHNVGVLRFVDAGTKALELENGQALNEPTTYAVRVAIEQAVYDMIVEGEKKGIWRFKKSGPVARPEEVKVEEKKDVVVQTSPISETKPQAELVPRVVPKVSNEVKKEEVKVEEKKDVVVQPQTKSETKTQTVSSAATEVKKEETKPLFGQRKLTEAQYIYREPDEKSQKTWQFKKGTIINVIQPGPEGWLRITDSEKRGGWIRTEQLEEVK
jgi:curli production assembly/transport component CsgG